MSDLTDRMRGTLRFGIIAPGSSANEYAVAERQFKEAMERIRKLEAENFALAARQCPFETGGLTADEYGNQYCAKDKPK